jgi:hypothetical protein
MSSRFPVGELKWRFRHRLPCGRGRHCLSRPMCAEERPSLADG